MIVIDGRWEDLINRSFILRWLNGRCHGKSANLADPTFIRDIGISMIVIPIAEDYITIHLHCVEIWRDSVQ